jgi:hypothetical protein
MSDRLYDAILGKTNGSAVRLESRLGGASAEASATARIETGNEPELDPLDPRNYRKPQDRRLNPNLDLGSHLPQTLEARRPKKNWFFRIHPDPDYRIILPLYTDDSKQRQSNIYLFSPGLKVPTDIVDLVRDSLVAAAITDEGTSFLYVLPVTNSGWYESGVEIITTATEQWVRQTPGSDGYIVTKPIAALPEPVFPDVPFRTYLERAFSKRVITSLDHPIIKKLRGDR